MYLLPPQQWIISYTVQLMRRGLIPLQMRVVHLARICVNSYCECLFARKNKNYDRNFAFAEYKVLPIKFNCVSWCFDIQVN